MQIYIDFFRSVVFQNYFLKAINQRHLCFCPVLETCYDVGEHEKVLRENEAKPSFLSALQVFYHIMIMFMKLDRNTDKRHCFYSFTATVCG